MAKVDWFVDGVLLNSKYQAAQDWSMIKKGGVEFAFSSQWEQGSAVLANNKQENVGRIQANNVIKKEQDPDPDL